MRPTKVSFHALAQLFIFLSIIRLVWTHRVTKESIIVVWFVWKNRTILIGVVEIVGFAPGLISYLAFDYLYIQFSDDLSTVQWKQVVYPGLDILAFPPRMPPFHAGHD